MPYGKPSKPQRRVGRKTVSRISKRHGLGAEARKTAKQKTTAKIAEKRKVWASKGYTPEQMAAKSRRTARRTTRRVAARRGTNIIPPRKKK